MDTIKRVQDLMQERDMNLCVLTKKKNAGYRTPQSKVLPSRRAVKRRDD